MTSQAELSAAVTVTARPPATRQSYRLPIQDENGQTKPYQVRQFLTVYRSENP